MIDALRPVPSEHRFRNHGGTVPGVRSRQPLSRHQPRQVGGQRRTALKMPGHADPLGYARGATGAQP